MKILMLGWELPPFNSGGLGEACFGLAKALTQKGAQITFVLPQKIDLNIDFMKLDFADLDQYTDVYLDAYATYNSWIQNQDSPNTANFDFVEGAYRFAKHIKKIALKESADIIHAHDWLTYPAAIAARQIMNKPFVAHIHSTELDRTGGHFPNETVYRIEKKGLDTADRVIPVSNFTKNMLVRYYGVSSDKIEVVHNGLSFIKRNELPPALTEMKSLGYKVVLFLGRITLMKGPEYFVRTAKRVLEYEKKVIFVVTGTGDMHDAMICEAAKLGVLNNFLFTGFLRGEDKDRIFRAADLYVMPSVSEPFGIAPLESMANGTPVLISKQSGVSEVIQHALKVDFWDTEEMANKIISYLRYPALKTDLDKEGRKELKNINWNKAADKCLDIYCRLLK